MNTILKPSSLNSLNTQQGASESETSTIPQLDLASQVQHELNSLEKEAQQKRLDDQAFEILRGYYTSLNILPGNISSIMNEGSNIKKAEILDSILDIYINNSNSLNCPEYSLFINSLTQKWAEETPLEKVLSPLSSDLKDEIKLLVLKQMVSNVDPSMDYRKALSKEEYLAFLNDPDQFYNTQKLIKNSWMEENYTKVMELSIYSSYSHSSDRKPRYTSHEDYIEALYHRIQLLDFHINRQKRINLLNSIISNLSEELKTYIKTNPENFRQKVARVHQKLNTPSPSVSSPNSLDMPRDSLSATSSPSPSMAPNDKNNPFRPIGLVDSFINMILFWKKENNAVLNSTPAPNNLTQKEKFQSQLSSAIKKVEDLKFQAVLGNPQTRAALDSILTQYAQISHTTSALNDAQINILSLEDAKVISRNIDDLTQSCQQANLLPSEIQEQIKKELEKMVLDTLSMIQVLSSSLNNQKNEMIVKNIQITNRLSNIRAQAQDTQQHMKLGK